MQTKSQFIGLTGQYYVCYCLAARGFHASLTIGNSPNVDVLVASNSGDKTLSVQVKTSRNAYRRTRYKNSDVHEWDVGRSAIGRSSKNLWYAFVDLQENLTKAYSPIVYLVPSSWVASFVKEEHSRKMFLLKSSASELCKEKWDNIQKYFNEDADIIDWLTNVPLEALWT